MLYGKLLCIFSLVAFAVVSSGCGSAPPAPRDTGPTAADVRQAIIDQHTVMAEQRIQELRSRQESELLSAGQPSEGQDEEIARLEQQLQSNLETDREEANATLSDQELETRLRELQEKYDSDLREGSARIREQYAGKQDEATAEMTARHEQELADLQAQLDVELQQKLAQHDQQQASIVAAQEQARQEETRQIALQEQGQRAAQERARLAAARAAQEEAEGAAEGPDIAAPGAGYAVQPVAAGPGTKAPVQPVVIPRQPTVTDRGLRREDDAPLGQRRYYVNRYFRSGEALQKIQPSDQLINRERHEMIVTFWMEGTPEKGVPRFMLNGVPVPSWQDLEKGLAEFRNGLIEQKYLLYAKVILDQRRDAPRSVVDDILNVCFGVGIRDISMGTHEPLMEE